MSCILQPSASSGTVRTSLFLGTDAYRSQQATIVNSSNTNIGGSGVGFTLVLGNSLRFVTANNIVGSGTATLTTMQTLTLNTPQLVVMQMIWGSGGNDTLNVYLPGTNLVQPVSPNYTFNSVDFDQTAFDTLSVSTIGTGSSPIDEIRLGATYAAVIGAGSGGGNAYSSWANTNAPTTGNDPTADEDGDGVSNGLECVLGGTISTNDLGKLPTVATTPGGDMTFSFQRDRTSKDGSAVPSIEVSTDLSDWSTSYSVPATATGVVNPGVTVVENSPSGFDTVTLTIPKSSDAKKYARLKVTVSP